MRDNEEQGSQIYIHKEMDYAKDLIKLGNNSLPKSPDRNQNWLPHDLDLMSA